MGRHIVQFIKSHWALPGGIEKYSRDCLEHIETSDQFEKVTVLYFEKNSSVSAEKFRSKIDPVPIKTFGTLRSTPIPKINRDLMRKLSSLRADVIHFHHPNPTMQPFLHFVRRRNPSSKLIVHYHSDIDRQKILRKLYRPALNRLLEMSDCIIATSPQYIQSSVVLHKYKDKCIALPFGVPKRDFYSVREDSPTSKNKFQILSVGRMVSYKGFKFLIEAVSQLKQKEIELRLVGAGLLLSQLKEQTRQLGLEQKITFLEKLSTKELEAEFRNCDLFVLPSVSRAEAFGLVILEAMSYGKAVITTKLGTGTEYLVENDENGLVVPPENSEALASAISFVIENPEARVKFASTSLKFARERFSQEKHFESLQEIYRGNYKLIVTGKRGEHEAAASLSI